MFNKVKKIIVPIFGVLFGLLLVLMMLSNTDSEKGSKKRSRSRTTEVVKEVIIDSVFVFEKSEDLHSLLQIHSVPVPEEVMFCGEKVPINIYYVKEALERELLTNSYLHSSTIQNLKRANRVFPVIEPILKRNDMPEDIKYLAVAESNLMNVVSASKATGVWQFMKETAKIYGLEVNDDVDERYHLEKSTEAACAFLKKTYNKYGSWAMAAASYNMGEGGLERVMSKQQDSCYYNLNLNSETARYVFRIIALKIIFEHPQDYGFFLKNNELYPFIPTQVMVVDTTISNLTQFAFMQGINYRILKEFNPWLRSYTLPNRVRKSYEIKIPKEGFIDYHKNLQQSLDTTWFEGF